MMQVLPTPLAESIKEIRRRLKKTTTALAHDLGVSQSAISQYERGRIVPSDRVLAQLLMWAQPGTEQSAILKALSARIGLTGRIDEKGKIPNEAQLLGRLREWSNGALLELDITKKNAAGVFQMEAASVLANRERVPVQPVLPRILRYWRQHGADPAVVDAFEEAAAFLNVRILSASRSEVSRKESPVRTTRRPTRPKRPSRR